MKIYKKLIYSKGHHAVYTVASKIILTSKNVSAQSWTNKTKVPHLCKLHAQENESKHIVMMWWTNICQKSLRLTSKNCETASDQ